MNLDNGIIVAILLIIMDFRIAQVTVSLLPFFLLSKQHPLCQVFLHKVTSPPDLIGTSAAL